MLSVPRHACHRCGTSFHHSDLKMAGRAGHRLAPQGSILTSHLTTNLITREDSMKGIRRFPKTLDLVVLTGLVLAGSLGMAVTAAAQDVSDLQTPKSPRNT